MSNVAHTIESMEPAWLERRQSERIEAKLRVGFRELKEDEAEDAVHDMEASNLHLLAYQAGSQDPGEIVQVLTRDISAEGIRLGGDMQLLAGRNISPGTFLLLEIELPQSHLTIRAIAMVAWSKVPSGNEFEAGLSIFTIDEGDLQELEKYIATHPDTVK